MCHSDSDDDIERRQVHQPAQPGGRRLREVENQAGAVLYDILVASEIVKQTGQASGLGRRHSAAQQQGRQHVNRRGVEAHLSGPLVELGSRNRQQRLAARDSQQRGLRVPVEDVLANLVGCRKYGSGSRGPLDESPEGRTQQRESQW